MKKFLLPFAFAFALLGVTAAEGFAQQAAFGGQKMDKDAIKAKMQSRMEAMAKELELTDAQKAKLEPIKDKYRKEFEKLAANESISRRDKMMEGFELMQNALAEVRTILTAEQNEKLDAMIEENRKKHASRFEKFRQMRQQQGGEAPAGP